MDLDVLEETLKLHKDKILAISLAGASNVSGAVLPIKTIRNMINDICPDIYFIIDASQYAPHHTINLNDADIFVFSGHKMYAPYGIGVVAGDKKLFANMRHSFKGGGDVEFITREDIPIYKNIPFNQEIGTPNFVGAIAIAESFRIINSVK